MATCGPLRVEVTLDASAFKEAWLSINEIRRMEGVRRKVTFWDCAMLLAGRRPNL